MQFSKLMRPTSLLFLFLNVVRLVGIIAMLALCVGEMISIAHNIQGYQNRNSAPAALVEPMPSLAPSTSLATPSSTRIKTRAVVTATSLSQPGTNLQQQIAKAAEAQATNLAKGNFFQKRFIDQVLAQTLDADPDDDADADDDDDSCGYVDSTDVPEQRAGILFVCLVRFLNIFILFFLVMSELAAPVISRFLAKYFRPLSSESGVGWLGCLMAFISSGVLSHQVSEFEEVVAWMVFVLGVINLTIGILLQGAVRETRSMRPDSEVPSSSKLSDTMSSLRARTHRNNTKFDMSPSDMYVNQPPAPRDRMALNISAPVRPTSPPAYLSARPAMMERARAKEGFAHPA